MTTCTHLEDDGRACGKPVIVMSKFCATHLKMGTPEMTVTLDPKSPGERRIDKRSDETVGDPPSRDGGMKFL